MAEELQRLKRRLAFAGALNRSVDHVADLINKHLARKFASESEKKKEAAWKARQVFMARLKSGGGNLNKTIADLRKEFESKRAVKDYRTVEGSVAAIRASWENYLGMSEAERTTSRQFLDQSLIVLFNKTLDPGSVVRESEFDRTPEMQALYRKITGQKEKILKGGTTLSNEEREALVNQMIIIAGGRYSKFKAEVDFFGKEARRSGISNPNRVVKEFGLSDPNYTKYNSFGELPESGKDEETKEKSDGLIKSFGKKTGNFLVKTLKGEQEPKDEKPSLPEQNTTDLGVPTPPFSFKLEKDPMNLFAE